MNREASGRLKARPPWPTGLSRKSPTVAPSGRVRMNAVQNNVTLETEGPVVEGSDNSQGGAEHQCAAFIPKPG